MENYYNFLQFLALSVILQMLEKKGRFLDLGEDRGTRKEDQGVVKSKNDLRMNSLDILLSGNLFTQQRLATFGFFPKYSWAIQKIHQAIGHKITSVNLPKTISYRPFGLITMP